MRIVLRPRAQVEEAWRGWEKESQPRQDPARPSVVMAAESASLLDRRELVFRGRKFNVPPTPYPLAARVLAVKEELRLLAAGSGSDVSAAIATFARAIELIRSGLRPIGFFRRLLWPITPNPFRHATPREVGELLGFFCAFLVLDGSVGLETTTPRGTSPRRSPDSSPRSQRGPVPTAGRSRGATS